MKRSGAPGTPGASAPSTSPAMRSSTVRAFVTRSALRTVRSRTAAARTTAPYSATKTSALTANATKASRSVKPPRPAGCPNSVAPRARAAHRENSEVLRVEVRKRSLASFDAVGAQALQRVAAAVGQVDVGVPPG